MFMKIPFLFECTKLIDALKEFSSDLHFGYITQIDSSEAGRKILIIISFFFPPFSFFTNLRSWRIVIAEEICFKRQSYSLKMIVWFLEERGQAQKEF